MTTATTATTTMGGDDDGRRRSARDVDDEAIGGDVHVDAETEKDVRGVRDDDDDVVDDAREGDEGDDACVEEEASRDQHHHQQRDAKTTPRPGAPRARGDAASEDARHRTVFVGGVHHECDEDRLRAFFEDEFGLVESVKMIYDRQTQARKGYGFVKFIDAATADAVRALEKVHIEGKAVDVKEATRDEPTPVMVDRVNGGNGGGRGGGAEDAARRGGATGARGGRLSRGGSRESLSDASGGGRSMTNATTMGGGGGVRRGASNGGERRLNGVPIAGARGYAEHVGAKTSVKAMARSPKYVGALDDGASESESGGSGTTSAPAPGTENTVFVGGLPMEASPEALGWYFAHYGTVLSVKLIYDKHTGQCKGYGFIVFADVAVAEMIKAHRQMPFMGKMIDVSEAMRHVGRPDDGRGYVPGYGGPKYGAHGPFYPPQMMYPPHMPMMHGQGPGVPMMFPHPMQFAGYPPMYGSMPYGAAPPTEYEKDGETAAAAAAETPASDE